MKAQPDHIVDLRNAIIPLILLKISQEFREIEVGEIMEIWVDDLNTKMNLFKILPASSYKLTELNNEGSYYRIRLIKQS